MACYKNHLNCKIRALSVYLDNAILSGSSSASLEDCIQLEMDGVTCITRVYERYSYIGSNRVSLTVTLFGRDGDVHLSAITSGGSQAIFFKLNTLGEQSFLDKFVEAAEAFKNQHI